MDDDSDDVEELFAEEGIEEEYFGEGAESEVIKEIIPKSLTREEASSNLSLLGKPADALGIELAYLKITLKKQKLTDISVLPSFRHVMFVDVSNNFLNNEALLCLGAMRFLLKLHADGNRLTSSMMPIFPFLQVLTLNRNSIESTEGIYHPSLQCLEMNYNKIRDVTYINPEILRKLKILEMRGNLLTTTAGILCPNLERLYLAENGMDKLEGLENMEKLRILHLRDNTIKQLNGFSVTMSCLAYINLRDCQIKKMKELGKLAVLPVLETLIIAGNPIVERMGQEYRIEALSYLPNLKRLDKDPVQQEEIEEAEEMRRRREGALGEEGEEESEGEEEDEEDEEDEEVEEVEEETNPDDNDD